MVFLKVLLEKGNFENKSTDVKKHAFSVSLLIYFAKSLELDQAHQYVGPDQDPTCMTL